MNNSKFKINNNSKYNNKNIFHNNKNINIINNKLSKCHRYNYNMNNNNNKLNIKRIFMLFVHSVVAILFLKRINNKFKLIIFHNNYHKFNNNHK